MTKYIHILFVAAGSSIALYKPLAGALIAVSSFAYGAFVLWIDAVSSTHEEKLGRMGSVVDANAKKLEVLIDEFQKLQGEFSMGQQMKGYGLK